MYDSHTEGLTWPPVDPDDRLALSRRIVEVTDHDESLFPEFVPVDPRVLVFNR